MEQKPTTTALSPLPPIVSLATTRQKLGKGGLITPKGEETTT